MSNPNWKGAAARRMSLHKQLEEYGEVGAMTREQYVRSQQTKEPAREEVKLRRLRRK